MREKKVAALALARKLMNAQINLSSCPLNGELQLTSHHCRKCPQLMPCSWRHRADSNREPNCLAGVDSAVRSDVELDRELALAQMLIQRAVDTLALNSENLLEAQTWLVKYSALISPSPSAQPNPKNK